MLPLFKLEEYLFEHEHKAEISLCGSGLDRLAINDLLAMADANSLAMWESLGLGYSTPQGLPMLRGAIAAQYGSVSAEDIMVFSGACEAIYIGMRALLNPADHVIVVTPCYQSLKSVAASVCEVTEVPLRFEERWRFHPERIQAEIRPNTRMIVINFPNNPTGALPTLSELQALVEIARAHDLWIFADEVYRLMEFAPADRLPPIADLYEKGLSVSSMSKAYGLPGLRIGWLATQDQTVISRLLSLRHYLTICPNTASEVLALMAIRAQDRILAANLTKMRENYGIFSQWMERHSRQLEWVPPKGGCLAYPRLINGQNAEQFSLELLAREKVLVLPGSLYDSPGEHLRLGFGSATLPEALSRFSRALTANLTPLG